MSLIASLIFLTSLQSTPSSSSVEFGGWKTFEQGSKGAVVESDARPRIEPGRESSIERPQDSSLPSISLDPTTRGGGALLRVPVEAAESNSDATPARTSPSESGDGPINRGSPAAPIDPTLPGETLVPESGPRLGEGPWATTWSDVPSDLDRLSAMTYIRGNGIADTSWTSDQYFNADVIGRDLSRQPAGRRTLFPWRYRNSLIGHPFDRIKRPDGTTESRPSPFVDGAVMAIRNELVPILDELVADGIQVDYFIGDIESSGHFACWNIDQSHIAAIMTDPRFDTRVLGNGLTPRQMLGDWAANQIKLRTPAQAAAAWNAVINRIFADAILNSMVRPVTERWPDARSSNYGSMTIDEDQAVCDMNGWKAWADCLAGTNPAIETYGRLGGVLEGFKIDPSDPTRLTRQPGPGLPANGWTSLQMDVNRTRALVRSDGRPYHLWFATPSWETDRNWRSSFANTPYFRENLFHQAVGGVRHFIYWNPINRDLLVEIDREQRNAESRVIETILDEIDAAMRGDVSSQPLRSVRIRWNSPILLSGAQLTDGSSIWRLTVAPDIGAVRLQGSSTLIPIDPSSPGLWISRPDASGPVVLETIPR